MNDESKQPRDDEVDLFGITHPGKVRRENEDNFLMCSIVKKLQVHFSSLPPDNRFLRSKERLGFLAAVTDGVGGAAAGEVASRVTLETLAEYVSNGVDCYFANDPDKEDAFIEQLREAVISCHERLLAERAAEQREMQTTFTMLITSWPNGYIVQVGDSRCYLLRGGALFQLTRDQTLAQEVIDTGVEDTEGIRRRWGSVLSSAIGGSSIEPVVTRTDLRRGDTYLLCSDGLTKHVSNERIREIITTSESCKAACEALVDAALADGGKDNITVLLGHIKD